MTSGRGRGDKGFPQSLTKRGVTPTKVGAHRATGARAGQWVPAFAGRTGRGAAAGIDAVR